MSVEFYCEDARKEFLKPKSVDLFLIHPPFFSMINESYGGDQDTQLHKIKDKKEFRTSMITILKNMDQALTDDGNILFILPNSYKQIETISDIIKYTDLTIYNILLWDFEKNKVQTNKYYTNLILHIRKNTNFEYPGKKLDRFFIEEPWATCYSAFPIGLSDILIKSFSKEGDTVADIFGGTGTTIISALRHNRKAIYSDSSSKQFELAKMRVNDILKKTEKDSKMNTEETIHFMVDSINESNRFLCEQAGMDKEHIDQQIEQSRQSMYLIVSELYAKMKDANLLA